MIVCGVELKSKEAILALVQGSSEKCVHLKSDIKRLTLQDDRDTKSLLSMKASIEAFSLQYKVRIFVIKSRKATGRLASSGITFKIEALFQLSGTPVVFVSPPTLAKFMKNNPEDLPEGILTYQADAYQAGAWHLSEA